MVIYDLICSLGHQFEAWFPGHEAFQKQLQLKLVQCQVCGDTGITKILSGGHFIQSVRSPRITLPSPTETIEKASNGVSGESGISPD